MLVVAALLAIVAALLVPAFHKVRESSLAAACLSNMRQISILLSQYAAEKNGFFPKVYEAGAVDPWAKKLVDEGLLPKDVLKVSAEKSGGILWCPGSTVRWSGMRDWLRGHYGLNAHLVGSGGTSSAPPIPSTPLTAVRNTSRIPLLLDSGAYSMTSFYANNPGLAIWYLPGSKANASITWRMDNQEDALHGRHNGRIHVCFADMHVESLKADEIINPELWKP